LDNRRRNQRCLALLASALEAQFSTVADLTRLDGAAGKRGGERFLNNPLVDVMRLREALYRITLAKSEQRKRVLAVFDPTLLDCSGHQSKRECVRIGNEHGLGYTLLDTAAVDPEDGLFLGVLHLSPLAARQRHPKSTPTEAWGRWGTA